MRAMCAAVLVFEAVVLGLTTPVMISVGGIEQGRALALGLGLTVAALVVAGLLRYPWAYALGSLVQLAAIAMGFVVPVMFLLGLLFAAFWVMALVLGRRIEAAKRARTAVDQQRAAGNP